MTTRLPPSTTSQLVALRGVTSSAIEDLADLYLDGPDAASARRAIRLTRMTLECFWLPALDAALATRVDGPTAEV